MRYRKDLLLYKAEGGLTTTNSIGLKDSDTCETGGASLQHFSRVGCRDAADCKHWNPYCGRHLLKGLQSNGSFSGRVEDWTEDDEISLSGLGFLSFRKCMGRDAEQLY